MKIDLTAIDRRNVVGINEWKVSTIGDCLITFALGSCLGISIYDPVNRIGGLIHSMLPDSSADTELREQQPAKFVDSGIESLVTHCEGLGASRRGLVVKAAGAAASGEHHRLDAFRIGSRNIESLKRTLRKNGLELSGLCVGGYKPRTMALDVKTGHVVVIVDGKQKLL